MSNRAFITVTDEGIINAVHQDDDVTLIILNTDHLEDYTFLYREVEVGVDSVNEDGTVNLIESGEDGDRILYNIPMEELDVIEGEEYLEF